MGVEFLPDELDGAELIVEAAFGEDPSSSDTSGWSWTDITEDVRFDDPVSITRGRSDEASTSQPAECTLTLDNNDAAYTRGPKSTHYPNVRRNVPMRMRVDGIIHGLSLPGEEGSYAHTEEDTSLEIAGDVDIRMDLDPDTWRPESIVTLCSRWDPSTDNRSWTFTLRDDGQLELAASDDGVSLTAVFRSGSDNTIPADTERLAVRATVEFGSGDCTVTFYTADTIDGTWTELGFESSSDITELHDGSAEVAVGAFADGSINQGALTGSVYAVQLYDGVDGTAVVDADFTAQDSEARAFTDSAGIGWELAGGATMVTGVLFFGYATGWTPSWNTAGTDSTVELSANGALRRLGQRQKPVRSSMFRDLSERQGVAAYWSLEDGERSGRFTSGMRNSSAALDAHNDVDFADFEDFPGADAIAVVNEGAIHGSVPQYLGESRQRFAVLTHVPEGGIHDTDDRLLFRVWTALGPAVRWDLYVTSSGGMYLRGYDYFGAEVYASSSVAFDINDRLLYTYVLFEQNGADVDLQFGFFEVGDTNATFTTDTFSNAEFGRITRLQLGDRRGTNGVAYGHVTVLNGDDDDTIWSFIDNALTGWNGERATDRIERLCDENRIPLQLTGTSNITMGPQPIDTLMTLLRECETADMGVLYDGIGPGLAYRARDQRESINPSVTVDVSAGELATDFEPVDDDQNIINEAVATQVDGSSVTVTETSGPMGTETIDVYDDEQEYNVERSSYLRDFAAWTVHLGTVDGYRYPSVSADMRATPDQAQQWLGVGPSSRLDLINPDAVFDELPDESIRLLAEGTEVELSPYQWNVTAQCSPYDPWRIIRVTDLDYNQAGEYVTHLDTVGSSLNSSVDKGATEMDVDTEGGPLWTTDSDAFPFEVYAHGTRVTVTDISGSTSPQTFTVDAVQRDLPADAVVEMYKPPVLGM